MRRIWCGLAAAVISCGARAGEPEAKAEEKSVESNIAALEAQLKERSAQLEPFISQTPAALEPALAASREMLGLANQLVRLRGEERCKAVPERAEILRPRLAGQCATFAAAPVVLYGKSTEEDTLNRWREQLRHAFKAARALALGEEHALRNWAYPQDWQKERVPGGVDFYRVEAARNTLLEASKLIALLSLPRQVERQAAGRALCTDDFTGALEGWQSFGGQVAAENGALRISGEGCTIWRKEEAGDALIAFEFTPLELKSGGGSLFAYPGAPNAGLDYAVSAGPMPNYNYGIHTYHVSLCRGDSGVTNLRRTGNGLRMLSTVPPDPCRALNTAYQVEILKRGVVLNVYVDGVLQHAYVDAGVWGPAPARGRFGIRHFAGGVFSARYARFRMHELAPVQP